MNLYSMTIQWSEEEQLFLATIPEFDEQGSHGSWRQRWLLPHFQTSFQLQAHQSYETAQDWLLEDEYERVTSQLLAEDVIQSTLLKHGKLNRV